MRVLKVMGIVMGLIVLAGVFGVVFTAYRLSIFLNKVF